MESWSSTASLAYRMDLGVKSTPVQSNKITDVSQPARLLPEKLQNSAGDKASKYRKMWNVESSAVLGTYDLQWNGLPSDSEKT